MAQLNSLLGLFQSPTTVSEAAQKELAAYLQKCHFDKMPHLGSAIGDSIDLIWDMVNWNTEIIQWYAKCLSDILQYERSLRYYTYLLEHRDLSDTQVKIIGLDRSAILKKLFDSQKDIDLISPQLNYLSYPEKVINQLVQKSQNKNDETKNKPKIGFTITTCKRTELFFKTINSFLHCCLDYHLIDEWICVDDNTDPVEREAMKRMYPFFRFIWKDASQKGHPRSMNILRDVLLAEKFDYVFHCEDDWHYLHPSNYLSKCFLILNENIIGYQKPIGQVLINRNYAEIPDHFKHVGGDRITLKQTRTENSVENLSKKSQEDFYYYWHRHYEMDTPAYREYMKQINGISHTYWPHFSFRPGLLRVSVLEKLGPYNEKSAHFEREYASAYSKCFVTAFLPTIYCQHIGRLTTERNDTSKANAYILNNQAQFTGKKKDLEGKTKVQVVPWWTSTTKLMESLNTQSQGNLTWGDMVLVDPASDPSVIPDYYCVWQSPGKNVITEKNWKNKALVLQTEPTSRDRVDIWGLWAQPEKNFPILQFRPHSLYVMPNDWHITRTYLEHLYGAEIIKNKLLSAIVTSKYTDPGHKLRVDFLRFLEKKADHPIIDIYSLDNNFHFKNFRGPLPNYYNDPGLMPYKYCFRAENNSSDNFFTEKVTDTIIMKCLLFYWGCPNLENFIPAQSFIRLPLEKSFEESYKIMTEAIDNNEWEKRLPYILQARELILKRYQFFPILDKAIDDLDLPLYVVNLDRRADRWNTIKNCLSKEWYNYQRFSAVDGKAIIRRKDGSLWTPLSSSKEERSDQKDRCVLDKKLKDIFKGNDFGNRRSFIGCALSHKLLWEMLVASNQDIFGIIEDDAELCENFNLALNSLLDSVENNSSSGGALEGWDIIYLGYHIVKSKRTKNTHDPTATERTLIPYQEDNLLFRWPDYRGGTYGYLISKAGARKLLWYVEKQGVKHGVDYFIYRNFFRHYFNSGLKVFFCSPALVYSEYVDNTQLNVDSDIQKDRETLDFD